MAFGRRLTGYLKTEELDALLELLALAIHRKADPLSYLRREVWSARRARNRSQRQEEDAVQLTNDRGALSAGYDGEDAIWASAPVESDPFLREQIKGALGKLSARQRACIDLKVEGHKPAEIALELNLSVKAVKDALYEAAKTLSRLLGEGGASE